MDEIITPTGQHISREEMRAHLLCLNQGLVLADLSQDRSPAELEQRLLAELADPTSEKRQLQRLSLIPPGMLRTECIPEMRLAHMSEQQYQRAMRNARLADQRRAERMQEEGILWFAKQGIDILPYYDKTERLYVYPGLDTEPPEGSTPSPG